MRPFAVLIAAIALAGCSTTAPAPASSEQTPVDASLSTVFPEAASPRVPTASELIGDWDVVAPAGQSYAPVSFASPASLDAESAGKTILSIGTMRDCNGMGGLVEVGPDGSLSPSAMPQTLIGCDETVDYPKTLPLESIEFIAVDGSGNLWLSGASQTYELSPAIGSASPSATS